MNVRDVAVCRTGTANLASVLAGLRRAGGAPRLTQAPGEILEAGHVMLPGVGSFGAAMETLRRSGTAEALKERMARERPTLAICVGLQLLCRASEESPGVPGLGLIDATITRFPRMSVSPSSAGTPSRRPAAVSRSSPAMPISRIPIVSRQSPKAGSRPCRITAGHSLPLSKRTRSWPASSTPNSPVHGARH